MNPKYLIILAFSICWCSHAFAAKQKHFCSKARQVFATAIGRVSHIAKKKARIIAGKKAKKRCGPHARFIWRQTWTYKGCPRRCRAMNWFRCCSHKKPRKTSHNPTKRAQNRQKQSPTRQRTPSTNSNPSTCAREQFVQAIGLGITEKKARRLAKLRIRSAFRKACLQKPYRVLGKWLFNCGKQGSYISCLSSVKIQCCEKQ